MFIESIMKDFLRVKHRNQGSHQSISPVMSKCYQRKLSKPLLKTQTMYVLTVKDKDKPEW